jgi:hypothetical protein
VDNKTHKAIGQYQQLVLGAMDQLTMRSELGVDYLVKFAWYLDLNISVLGK